MHWFLTLLGSVAVAHTAAAAKPVASAAAKHPREAPPSHSAPAAPPAVLVPPQTTTVYVVPDTEPHDRHDPIYWGASGLIAGVTALLYLQHGRRRRDRSGGRGGSPGLRLVPNHGNTVENTPGAAPVMPETAAKNVEAALRAEGTDTKLRRSGVRPVPFSLKTYFTMQPREQILWAAPYNVIGHVSGMVALTNKRVLAVHHKRRINKTPLRMMTTTSQDDFLLTSVNKAEVVRTHRTWMLMIPALSLWFHPWGVVIAAASLMIYSAWPRRQLALYAGSKRYLYPLPDLDQREMLHLLNQPAPPAKAAA